MCNTNENCRDFNKFFTCYSGVRQRGTQKCSRKEYSLLLNDINRELRTISFNLLNDTSEDSGNTNAPKHCELEGIVYSFVLFAIFSPRVCIYS